MAYAPSHERQCVAVGRGSVAVAPAVGLSPPHAFKEDGCLLVGAPLQLYTVAVSVPRSKAANDGELVSIHWSK